MKKTFLLNLALLIGINLLIKPFYAFGIDLQVQNRVGTADYGLYFALFNFSFLFQIISDMGLQQFNNRFVAQHPVLLPKYLPHFLGLKALLAIAFLLLSVLTALIVGYGSEEWKLLPFLLLNQVLITLIFFLRSNLSGLQLFKLDSLLSALDKLLLILLMLIVLWGPFRDSFRIEFFVYAQSLSFAITAFSIWLILRWKIKTRLKWQWKPKVMLAVLRQSWPYALVVFLMTIYTRIDAVMIERLLGPDKGAGEAGIYGFGYRILDAFNMIGFLFAGLLLPMYARMLKNKEDFGDLMRSALQWMLLMTICLSFSVHFYGKDLTRWMLTDYSAYTVDVFQLLIWSSNAVGIIYIFGTLLTANASLKAMNQVFGIGIVLNLLGNLLLIPRYGALGAAWATLVTQSFVAVAEVILVFRLLPQLRNSFAIKDLWKLVALPVGAFLLFGASSSFLEAFVDWRLSLVLAGMATAVWAEAIGFLDLKGLITLMRSKVQKQE